MIKKCVIITAAGMSTRLNQNKLLIRSCHETIIEKTVHTFTDQDIDIFVVIGHQKKEIRAVLENRYRNDIQIIENEDYKSGIASSIKTGLFLAGKSYDYYGFCNGDKPFIKAESIKRIVDYLENNKPKILVPLYQDKSGHPTFFRNELFEYFFELNGDTGGKKIIERFPNSVTYLPIDDEGIIIDMDKYLSK